MIFNNLAEYDQPHESQTNKDIVETIHRKGLGEGGGTKSKVPFHSLVNGVT